jgi:RNA polymerase sigma-70 factor (ECF subfamily)
MTSESSVEPEAKSELSLSAKAEFEKLVNANMKRAYFTALGIVGSHDAAMDLSQEAFIRVFRNFNKYDRSKNFFTWYYRILKNLCLNYIRDNKAAMEKDFLIYLKDKASSLDVFESFESKEMKQKLEEALFKLDIEDREIIIMKEFEDLSYNEIAEALDIPKGTVMSRLFYARKRLAERLRKEM